MPPFMDPDERNELLDTISDTLAQACGQRDGTLDSLALTAYADAMKLLARYGRLTIDAESGRRVIARFANGTLT